MRTMDRKYQKTTASILSFLLALLLGLSSTCFAFSLFGSSSPFSAKPSYYKQDFWYHLRKNFRLNHYAQQPQVSKQINWFSRHPAYFQKLLRQAKPYMYYIFTQTQKRNLPGELVLVPLIESAYDPFAYSHRGAAGLWQLMPGTASGYGIKQNWWYDGRRDIFASTTAALDYLTYLGKFFDDDWLYALAAYDAGEGTLQQAIKKNTRLGKYTDFWYLALPRETHAYVPRILALAEIIAHPHKYGIELPAIENHPYFASVNVGTQIDLAHAAKLADIPLKELYRLNPGFNRWATDPEGPHRLLLPVDSVERFKTNLAQVPAQKRVTWNRYHVKQGDSLSQIAHKFKTRGELLQNVNRLKTSMIHPGQALLIPLNTKNLSQNLKVRHQQSHHKAQSHPGPQKLTLIVQANDSVWTLANRYGVKPNEIRFWNQLKINEKLHPGQQLILWLERKHRRRRQHIKQITWVPYRVKSGDNLKKLAHQRHISTATLMQVNQLNSGLLKVGQHLKVPKLTTKAPAKPYPSIKTQTYKIMPGDTLYAIAKKNHISVKHLKALNAGHLKKYIHTDDVIQIPKH